MDQYNIDPFNLDMIHIISYLLTAYAVFSLSCQSLSSSSHWSFKCQCIPDHHFYDGLKAYGPHQSLIKKSKDHHFHLQLPLLRLVGVSRNSQSLRHHPECLLSRFSPQLLSRYSTMKSSNLFLFVWSIFNRLPSEVSIQTYQLLFN